MLNHLIPVNKPEDVLPEYKNTAIEKLLLYHNLDYPFVAYTRAELLVGMCMDNRKSLHIPDNFAYIIRSGGGNLRYSEFKVSYAIGVGGISAIALIGHTNCGMVNLVSQKDRFVEGLVSGAGWDRGWAEEHFMHFAPMFEIGNETDFVISEAKRLRLRYPKVTIAPLLYKVEDNLLYLLEE